MDRYLAFLTTAGMLMALATHAQTPPVIEGRVYVATYVEVLPSAVSQAGGLLKQYRDASRKESGALRMEVLQESGRPTRFVILSIWPDQKTFDSHGKVAQATAFRDKLRPIQAAPYDERVHSGFAVATPASARPAGVVVVTHVDVPPPLRDTVEPMLKALSEAGRKEGGSLRFEVGQQANRPNHFTVVELWADQAAYEAHVAAQHTRQFREKLGTMLGALYDERLYTVVE
jgi:quinol monooxygenase YgiN